MISAKRSSISHTLYDLARTLDTLDQASRESCVGAEQRREPRRPVRARCELYLFRGCGAEVVTLNAVARNLTFGGLSVVFLTVAPVGSGRPVEVLVDIPDHAPTYLAGVVVFCREVDDGRYELGIEVKATGRHPILCNDLPESCALYEWFAKALTVAE
ncbi:MAG: PilZ domain-containing protein [Phycisphaerae bacterium]